MDTRIIWGVGGFVLVLAIVHFEEINAKTRVKRFLQKRNCEVISIKTRLFGAGRGTIAFDVEYEDINGIKRKNTCAFQARLISEEVIHWQYPLETGYRRRSNSERDEAG